MPVQFEPITTDRSVNAGLSSSTGADSTLARMDDGGYVVCWTAGGTIFAQRFDGYSNRVGGLIQIAAPAGSMFGNVAASPASNGNIALTWTRTVQVGGVSDGDVMIGIFDPTGAEVSSPAVVHAAASTDQGQSTIARLSNGNLVVTWTSYSAGNSDSEVAGRIFTASGTPVGDQFALSNDTTGSQSTPTIGALVNGGFVAAWTQDAQGANPYTDVAARIFFANGSAVADQFTVNLRTLNLQQNPSAAGLADGGFVIAYLEHDADGSGWGVFARQYEQNGTPEGPEILINNLTIGDQHFVDVTRHGQGFVAVWAGQGGGTSSEGIEAYDIWGRVFSSVGFPVAVGDQFRINQLTPNMQLYPEVALLAGDRFVTVWTSDGDPTQSPDFYSRIFSPAGTTPFQDGALHDFNGDGRSDILWRSSTGQLSDWLGQANGGFAGNDGNAFSNVPTNWSVAGIGDFNGDGRDDIVWRSNSGAVSDWLGQANGGFVTNDANAFTNVPTSWSIAGTGDFNGDGRDDVLWRSDSGAVSDWLGQANGGFVTNDGNAFSNVPTNWHIAGTGDFNGDGRDDILWRSDGGAFSNWLGTASGGFVTNDANAFSNVPTSWNVVGTGDFNGDGRDDIIWRSDSGAFSDWLGTASGGFVTNDANALSSAATNWHVADVGDYNGDGRDDVLWRSDSGQLSDWLGTASGGFVTNDANAFNNVPTNWLIQSPDSLWV